MKKLIKTGLLLFVAFFVFPLCANADIIGTVSLQEYNYYPDAIATFPGLGTLDVYLNYKVSINGAPQTEAFCVENAWSPSGAQTYTVLAINAGLSAYLPNANATDYIDAAKVAQYYMDHYYGTADATAEKAAAQIAIWELIFDGHAHFDLSSGSFYTSAYNSQANKILTDSANSGTDGWALAVNPPIQQGGTVYTQDYQNYLVRVGVPEPGTLLLLGLGLLGFVGLRRKK